MSSQTPLTATSLAELCPTDRNFPRRNKLGTRPPVSTETTLKRWGEFSPSRLRKTKVLQDIISSSDVSSSRRNGEEIIQKFLAKQLASPPPSVSHLTESVENEFLGSTFGELYATYCIINISSWNIIESSAINAHFFVRLQKISEIT